MAANTVTAGAGTVTGTDPSFIVTKKTSQSNGVVLYLKYTKGTEAGITLTFDVINPSLHATDKYRHTQLSGSTLQPYSFSIFATGNSRIPIPVISGEQTICVNIAFSNAACGGTVVANLIES
jgi:hypothetical protein